MSCSCSVSVNSYAFKQFWNLVLQNLFIAGSVLGKINFEWHYKGGMVLHICEEFVFHEFSRWIPISCFRFLIVKFNFRHFELWKSKNLNKEPEHLDEWWQVQSFGCETLVFGSKWNLHLIVCFCFLRSTKMPHHGVSNIYQKAIFIFTAALTENCDLRLNLESWYAVLCQNLSIPGFFDVSDYPKIFIS